MRGACHVKPDISPILLILLFTLILLVGKAPSSRAWASGDFVLLVNNDLGMHCMNQSHKYLSILPPYNNLQSQIILKGDATRKPRIITGTYITGSELTYSIPGNTYSVGKTDFWTYDQHLFGVDLPDNVGLTGNGLTGSFTPIANGFIATGIPVTPFPDATPTVEHPYQKALIELTDSDGTVLVRSTPVIPVSVEVNCVTSGLRGWPRVSTAIPGPTPAACAAPWPMTTT
ncbi:hypothetical protein GW813_03090 [bacterium]|nr:hypothetical protein [bacterium]